MANLDDSESIEELFSAVFGGSRANGTYPWLFFDCPRAGISVVAESEGHIVGHAGSVTRALQYGNQELLMGTSVDAMTHPGWQKRGINRLLAQRLIEENCRKGIHVFGGFSNENSTYSALKYQGRSSLGTVPLLVRPLKILTRPWRILSRSTEEFSSQELHWPEDMDTLCSLVSVAGMGSRRDPEYLKWRYRRPGGIYHLVEHRQEGELVGLGVLGLRSARGLKLGFVMEVLCAPSEKGADGRVLALLLQKAKGLGCDAVCALGYKGTSMRRKLTRRAFVPVMPRFVGEHIDFSIRRLTQDLDGQLMDARTWNLTWGDTDLV